MDYKIFLETNLFYLWSRKHLKHHHPHDPPLQSMSNQHVSSHIIIVIQPTDCWPCHCIFSPLKLYPSLFISLKLCPPCLAPPLLSPSFDQILSLHYLACAILQSWMHTNILRSCPLVPHPTLSLLSEYTADCCFRGGIQTVK